MNKLLRAAAALALALLILGLLVLAVGDQYEGPVVLALDAQHALRALDVAGSVLIAGAIVLAWGVALIWERCNACPALHYGVTPGGEWFIGKSR